MTGFNRSCKSVRSFVIGRDRPEDGRFLAEIRAFSLGARLSRGLLQAGGAHFACAFGRSGLARAKREGDGATPLGTFPLRRLHFRPDREPLPATGLPLAPLRPDMGWCDDPSCASYNRPVRLPSTCRHERMWREDRLYDLCIEIGYNDDPPLRGRGSAIFLHLAREDFRPTEGCVALTRRDMLRLLPRLGPGTVLRIG